MGISQFIKDKAMELGFSACGIAEVAEELDDEAGWAYVAKIVFGALGRKDTGKE